MESLNADLEIPKYGLARALKEFLFSEVLSSFISRSLCLSPKPGSENSD